MIRLRDTLSGTLVPVPDGPVCLYVCGVTPYDTTHIGHAFTFVQFDVLVRTLRWLGREVMYVQNVTDIDESILAKARERATDWKTLGDSETARLVEDMRALRAEPDRLVTATSCMDTIRDMIAVLLEQGTAYAVDDGTVFFRISAVATYGELSGLPRERMLAISASQDDADTDDLRKEDPLDFALWRSWSGGPDEPSWEAPWGRGRPGWHIECSAINLRYLGPQVTIHGGGEDLIFPHHESEIAQSEAATGVRPFARIWMHTAMTRMSGEKMSKSLGNLVYVRDLLERHSPAAVRLALIAHRYRVGSEWSEEALREAADRLERLQGAAREPDRSTDAEERLRAALADDLDTPGALEAIDRAAGPTLVRLAGVLGLRLAS